MTYPGVVSRAAPGISVTHTRAPSRATRYALPSPSTRTGPSPATSAVPSSIAQPLGDKPRVDGVREARERAPLRRVDVDGERHEPEAGADRQALEVLAGLLGADGAAVVAAVAADDRAVRRERRAGRVAGIGQVAPEPGRPRGRDERLLVAGRPSAGDVDAGRAVEVVRARRALGGDDERARRGRTGKAQGVRPAPGVGGLGLVEHDRDDRAAARGPNEARVGGTDGVVVAAAADEEDRCHGRSLPRRERTALAPSPSAAAATTTPILVLALVGGARAACTATGARIWNSTLPSHLWGRLAGIEMLSWSSGPTLGGAEAPRPRRRDPDARGVRTVFDRPERPQEQDRG